VKRIKKEERGKKKERLIKGLENNIIFKVIFLDFKLNSYPLILIYCIMVEKCESKLNERRSIY